MLILFTKANDCIFVSSAMLGQQSNASPIRHVSRRPDPKVVMLQPFTEQKCSDSAYNVPPRSFTSHQSAFYSG